MTLFPGMSRQMSPRISNRNAIRFCFLMVFIASQTGCRFIESVSTPGVRIGPLEGVWQGTLVPIYVRDEHGVRHDAIALEITCAIEESLYYVGIRPEPDPIQFWHMYWSQTGPRPMPGENPMVLIVLNDSLVVPSAGFDLHTQVEVAGTVHHRHLPMSSQPLNIHSVEYHREPQVEGSSAATEPIPWTRVFVCIADSVCKLE